MALRKYITKVTTKEGKTTDLSSSATTTRNPSIDTATIDTEYTATYKHRKDPVTVKTGDIVTYNISVYNEGTKAGRVTKIVDQDERSKDYKENKSKCNHLSNTIIIIK